MGFISVPLFKELRRVFHGNSAQPEAREGLCNESKHQNPSTEQSWSKPWEQWHIALIWEMGGDSSKNPAAFLQRLPAIEMEK